MHKDPQHHLEIEGNMVAELLELDEYPSKVGHVAAVSDEQIVLLKRDRQELTGFKLEYHDIGKCSAIEYQDEMAWYRVAVAVTLYAIAVFFVVMLLRGVDDLVTEGGPMIIGAIAFVTTGIRFMTSTHRHVIRFEMPGDTLIWRSPATDFKFKAEAAHAVKEYARGRGILKGG